MKYIKTLLPLLLTLVGCSGQEAVIEGRFSGHSEKTVYLEKLLPNSITIADSAVLGKKGEFRFRVKTGESTPVVFNLREANEIIPLIVSPGEKITVRSIGSISENYTVSGSDESSKVKELKTILSGGSNRLDSLLTVYSSTKSDSDRQQVSSEYSRAYFATKRAHIKFIVENPGNLAGLYALYQRLPNDYNISSPETDVIYYRLVADSLSQTMPRSPYLAALQRELSSADRATGIRDVINEQLGTSPDGYPDITMNDMYGKPHRLSDSYGKVIILDFWSTESSSGRFNNAEYKVLFNQLSDRGLVIYQVAVDQSRYGWVSAVQEQKLPWISVCDMLGPRSLAVMAYNVRTVPANFIIDREGNIVSHNVYGEELAALVGRLL